MPSSRALAAAACLAGALLAGCASHAPAPHGAVRGPDASGQEWLQSDVNRMATLAMQANLDSLYRLMDKLYQRNPRQWRSAGHTNRAQAMAGVRRAIAQQQPWAPLEGRRDVAALALALSPDFAGDRVAAFIHATADMIVTAHGGKTSFYLTDSLDAQHLYNAARNVEIAVWLLAQRRGAEGRPLLLADAFGPDVRNLSFEREFGKIIGRLDLLATVLAERHRRAAINYVQGFVAAPLLAFLPVR